MLESPFVHCINIFLPVISPSSSSYYYCCHYYCYCFLEKHRRVLIILADYNLQVGDQNYDYLSVICSLQNVLLLLFHASVWWPYVPSRSVPLYACSLSINISSIFFHSQNFLNWVINYIVTPCVCNSVCQIYSVDF